MAEKEKEKIEKADVKKPGKNPEKKEKKEGRKLPFMRKKEKPAAKEAAVIIEDPYEVLRFVLMTEKSVRQVELQNKLVFIVDRKADKAKISAAAQSAFNSPIANVRTMIDQSGRKKAFIKFRNAGAAGEIAIRLGII